MVKDRKDIHLTISGLSRSGKTTLAMIIARALEKEGIACEVVDGRDDDYGAHYESKLRWIKEQKPLVKIRTEHAPA